MITSIPKLNLAITHLVKLIWTGCCLSYSAKEKESPLDYLDKTKAKKVSLSNLKPSTEVISLRLPSGLLSDIKLVANKNVIPYQSFMKMMLAEKIKENLVSPGRINPQYKVDIRNRL